MKNQRKGTMVFVAVWMNVVMPFMRGIATANKIRAMPGKLLK